MTRKEFLSQLEQALQGMPAEECRRAVEYYENYFDEAGPENEQEVLQQLGAPEKVAADILRDYRDIAQHTDEPHTSHEAKASGNTGKSKSTKEWFQTLDRGQKLLLLVLLIAAACVILPVGVGVIGGLGGIIVAFVCLVAAIFFLVPALDLAAWAAMVALFFAAGVMLSNNVVISLLLAGLALIFAACGIWLGMLTKYLFCTVFPALIRSIIEFFRRLLHFS